MKDTIITAGPVTIALDLPQPFLRFCKKVHTEPAKVIQQFMDDLSVKGFYCKPRSDREATTALIFNALVKANQDLPDEPFLQKRAVSARHLLRLNDAQYFEQTPEETAEECRQIIEEWYNNFQKLKQ